jgi:hypothetical protein
LEQRDIGIYGILTPLYFPWNSLEKSRVLHQSSNNSGGRHKKLFNPDHQIRIIHNPQDAAVMMMGSK